MQFYIVVLNSINSFPMSLASFIHPCSELFLDQNSQHVLHPLLSLFWYFFHIWEIFVKSSSFLDEANKITHIEAFNLWAMSTLDLIVLDIFLLAKHDLIHKTPIFVISRQIYPEQFSYSAK